MVVEAQILEAHERLEFVESLVLFGELNGGGFGIDTCQQSTSRFVGLGGRRRLLSGNLSDFLGRNFRRRHLSGDLGDFLGGDFGRGLLDHLSDGLLNGGGGGHLRRGLLGHLGDFLDRGGHFGLGGGLGFIDERVEGGIQRLPSHFVGRFHNGRGHVVQDLWRGSLGKFGDLGLGGDLRGRLGLRLLLLDGGLFGEQIAQERIEVIFLRVGAVRRPGDHHADHCIAHKVCHSTCSPLLLGLAQIQIVMSV